MEKSEKLTLRLSTEDFALLRARAAETGVGQSAYIRMLIRGAVPKAIPSGPFMDTISELREIGGIMTQIAGAAQVRGEIDAREYRATAKRLFEAVLVLESAAFEPERIGGA